MEGVLAAFAQFDNDVRSDRTRAGMKAALELGRWVFLAPIGYLNAPTRDGQEPVHDPERAPLIQPAFVYQCARVPRGSRAPEDARGNAADRRQVSMSVADVASVCSSGNAASQTRSPNRISDSARTSVRVLRQRSGRRYRLATGGRQQCEDIGRRYGPIGGRPDLM
jgi:hypothetical protein